MCGSVDLVNVITDRDTGQNKGFAFVEMSSDSEAQKAIHELNGSTGQPRLLLRLRPQWRQALVVNFA